MGKIAAIHQPNFFPWLGYFDKIMRSDTFVFLDDVQFPKKGGSWSNRVKILVSGESNWITANISRKFHGTRKINEMIFGHDIPWRKKILKSIELEYSRHPYFGQTMEIFVPLLMNPEPNIAEFNIHAIKTICLSLGIDISNFCRSSTLSTVGRSTELLCSITKSTGCDTYLCGGGAVGYQNDEVFAAHRINLSYQNFSHPMYPQHRYQGFSSGLSIIDALMNLGFTSVVNLLESNKL